MQLCKAELFSTHHFRAISLIPLGHKSMPSGLSTAAGGPIGHLIKYYMIKSMAKNISSTKSAHQVIIIVR
jgi:hypothetical protein